MEYNYLENIKEDILTNYEKENLKKISIEELDELMWTDDNITGNASGSYTFNTYKAEEYLTHNLDLLKEALEMFGYTNIDILEKGAEWCDVTIRCYLLNQAIAEIKEELENE